MRHAHRKVQRERERERESQWPRTAAAGGLALTRRALPSLPAPHSVLHKQRFSSPTMETTSDPTPAAGVDGYTEIVEGQASMLYDVNEIVFYNKVQVLNRDLSIQVISHFSKIRQQEWAATAKKKSKDSQFIVPDGIVILDALAATGLRSIRYLKEIPGVNRVIINDYLPAATEAAKKNVSRNGVSLDRVHINTGDANIFMYQHKEPGTQFDVIDLDPYGSASPFIDAAVQAVADGGLLCVTCTDMPVLSGNYPETCFAKYGTFPVKTRYHTESALRSLLNALETSANRYKKYIEPWASVAIDFYCRVFVRVHVSPAEVKNSCTKRGNVHQSAQCGSFFLQSMAVGKDNGTWANANATAPTTCPETGGRMKLGGPYYLAAMHNKEAVNAILANVQEKYDVLEKKSGTKSPAPSTAVTGSETALSVVPLTVEEAAALPIPTIGRLHGLLTAVSEELNDAPFFYHLSDLCSQVRSSAIPLQIFQSALVNGGYEVSQTHKEPMAIKTNAPDSVVWDIVRCWCIQNPPQGSSKRKKESNASIAILAKKPEFIADFTLAKSVIGRSKALRHPPNPEDSWGPKKRAGRGPSDEPEPAGKKAKKPNLTTEEKEQRAAEWRAKSSADK